MDLAGMGYGPVVGCSEYHTNAYISLKVGNC